MVPFRTRINDFIALSCLKSPASSCFHGQHIKCVFNIDDMVGAAEDIKISFLFVRAESHGVGETHQ